VRLQQQRVLLGHQLRLQRFLLLLQAGHAAKQHLC
jgi:hypothetical protein